MSRLGEVEVFPGPGQKNRSVDAAVPPESKEVGSAKDLKGDEAGGWISRETEDREGSCPVFRGKGSEAEGGPGPHPHPPEVQYQPLVL